MSELPEGWVNARLPEVANVVMGQSPPGATYNEEGIGLPFFQGKADFGSRSPVPRVWCSSPLRTAKPGDVLISVRAPVGPTNVADQTCAIGRGLAAIRPRNGVLTEWLLYRLRIAQRELEEQATGSTFSAIGKRTVESLDINVPPLAEQRRIIAAVESLSNQVRQSETRLEAVIGILKRLDRAALAAAWSGELVNVAPPEMVPLSDIIVEGPQNGLYKPLSAYGHGVLIVRIDDFHHGRLVREWSQLRRLRVDRNELAAFAIRNGDVLINRVNSAKFLGKPLLVTGLQEPAVFESNMMRLRLDLRRANPEFVVIMLLAPQGAEALRANAKHAVNQSSINQQDVRSVEIPLPPLDQQERIVQALRALSQHSDKLKRQGQIALNKIQSLQRSALIEAFASELVPTEAELARAEGRDYESGEQLLERISRERAASVTSSLTKPRSSPRAPSRSRPVHRATRSRPSPRRTQAAARAR